MKKYYQTNETNKMLQILRAHAIELLETLGMSLETAYINNNDIRGRTICHDGDNNNGLVYYHNSGRWVCFTANCHMKYVQNLFGLIMSVKNVTYYDAVKWADEFISKIEIDEEKINEIVKNKGKKIISTQNKEDVWKMHLTQYTHDPSIITALRTPDMYAKMRGLDLNMCFERGIGYAEKGKMVGRVVFPIYNAVNKIIGFSGRIVKDKQSPIKWMHWPSSKNKHFGNEKGFKPGINFYNINYALRDLLNRKQRIVILTEGIIDVLKLSMAGYNNALACFGCNITNAQVGLLKKCGIEGVILAFDNDEAGSRATTKSCTLLNKNLIETYLVDLGKNKDIGEMSKKEVRNIFGKLLGDNA